MHRWVLAVLYATVPLLAAAQTIYKVEMPDGSILFTDAPPPGAKVLEEREATSSPRPAPRTSSMPPGTSASPAPGFGPDGMPIATAARKPSALDSAISEVNEAERALAVAKQKLEQGREPLPGERLGLKGGGSRLTPEYQARVAALERDVATAEARLKRAYDARNAAR
jgi:hypothetical protein